MTSKLPEESPTAPSLRRYTPVLASDGSWPLIRASVRLRTSPAGSYFSSAALRVASCCSASSASLSLAWYSSHRGLYAVLSSPSRAFIARPNRSRASFLSSVAVATIYLLMIVPVRLAARSSSGLAPPSPHHRRTAFRPPVRMLIQEPSLRPAPRCPPPSPSPAAYVPSRYALSPSRRASRSSCP